MIKLPRLLLFIVPCCVLLACNQPKPKAISNNIEKTTVAVGGSTDSVVNNSNKNYGNATVSEPCVKCLLQIIQQDKNYTTIAGNTPTADIVYNVNWITSKMPKSITKGETITNGMQIDINKKSGLKVKELGSYLYNNATSKMYTRIDPAVYTFDSNVDTASLKKIRRSCFWGVASAK